MFKAVKSHIVWVEPMSGMAFFETEEDAPETDGETIAPSTAQADRVKAANG